VEKKGAFFVRNKKGTLSWKNITFNDKLLFATGKSSVMFFSQAVIAQIKKEITLSALNRIHPINLCNLLKICVIIF